MEELIDVKSTEVLAFAGYQELEAAGDRTAAKIKEGYMEMGYILKVARDTDILRESAYSSHEEFAEKRYGLDKGTVSRYIRIVERFSVDGNSHVLKENYKSMGFAKLSIMLHMPDAIAEELMDSLSKAEVQAIREELDAEGQVSDIELAIEGAEAAETVQPPAEGNMLTRAVWQLGKEQPDIYRKIWKAFEEGDRIRVRDILAPQGDAVYMTRIPGTGRMMVSISGVYVSVTAVRTQEKERYTMQEMVKEFEKICPVAGMSVEDAYKDVYGEELEPHKKEKVAPVQPKKEKRKESKVTKARTEKPAPVVEAEQIEGQDNIMNHPEYLPDSTRGAQYEEGKEDEEQTQDAVTEEPAGSQAAGNPVGSGEEERPSQEKEDTDTCRKPDAGTGAAEGGGCETDPGSPEDNKNVIAGYKAGIASGIKRLEMLKQEERWESMLQTMDDIRWRIEQIRKLSGDC